MNDMFFMSVLLHWQLHHIPLTFFTYFIKRILKINQVVNQWTIHAMGGGGLVARWSEIKINSVGQQSWISGFD